MLQRVFSVLVTVAVAVVWLAVPVTAPVAADAPCPTTPAMVATGGTSATVQAPMCFALSVPDDVTQLVFTLHTPDAPLMVYADGRGIVPFADPDDLMDQASPPGDTPYPVSAAFLTAPVVGIFPSAAGGGGTFSITSDVAGAGSRPAPGCDNASSSRQPPPNDLHIAQVAAPTPAAKPVLVPPTSIVHNAHVLLPINSPTVSKCVDAMPLGATSPGSPAGAGSGLGSAPGAQQRIAFKIASQDPVSAVVTWTSDDASTLRLILDGPNGRSDLVQAEASTPSHGVPATARIDYRPQPTDDAAGWWRLRVVNVHGGTIVDPKIVFGFTVVAPNAHTRSIAELVGKLQPETGQQVLQVRPEAVHVLPPEVISRLTGPPPTPTPPSAPAPMPTNYCATGAVPTFVLGFADLRSRIGDAMGGPIECEHANPDNGDTLQQTTTGLSFYRKSTNTPTFTNGWDHWGLTSAGLVYWTGSSIDPPASQ